MNKFEEMLKKLLENDVCYLYQNGKYKCRVKYCSRAVDNSKLWLIVSDSYSQNLGHYEITHSNINTVEILTKEEVNKMKEIEEEKKPKLEIGKTYVMRRKGSESCHYCYIKDFTNKCFYRQIDFSESKWFNISDFDFQKVDISIHEFFTTDPKSHWKN